MATPQDSDVPAHHSPSEKEEQKGVLVPQPRPQ